MKKKLEAELISIAHRVLKLKNKEDVIQLHQEAQKLYEKLSILRFYEENIEAFQTTISKEKIEETIDKSFEEKVDVPVQESEPDAVVSSEQTVENQIEAEEKIIVGALEFDEEEEELIVAASESTVTKAVEEERIEEEKTPKQFSIDDLLVNSYEMPDFVKKDEVTQEVSQVKEIVSDDKEKLDIEVPDGNAKKEKVSEELLKVRPLETIKNEIAKEKSEHKSTSLNDQFNKTITLGLNDRIAFEKHLFGGSGEDLNRVLSQLNTMDTLEEAKNFIADLVKPDYNNWNGKDEYADRFMELIEKKFA